MASPTQSLRRALQRVVPVRDDEVALTLWSVSYLFCVLRAYYMLRAVRDEIGAELAMLHVRLVEPATVFVLSLLAVPLGLRVERDRSLAPPAFYGVATVAAFFAAQSTAATLAVEAVIPPAAGVWTVPVLFLVFAAWHVRRESR